MRYLLIPLFTLLVTGCVLDSYTIRNLDPIDKDQVTLYFTDYPSCEYERVGFIESTGAYLTKEDTFDYVLEEAARMGADGVVIDYLQRSEIKYYSVVAEAIRCFEPKLAEPSY